MKANPWILSASGVKKSTKQNWYSGGRGRCLRRLIFWFVSLPNRSYFRGGASLSGRLSSYLKMRKGLNSHNRFTLRGKIHKNESVLTKKSNYNASGFEWLRKMYLQMHLLVSARDRQHIPITRREKPSQYCNRLIVIIIANKSVRRH